MMAFTSLIRYVAGELFRGTGTLDKGPIQDRNKKEKTRAILLDRTGKLRNSQNKEGEEI